MLLPAIMPCWLLSLRTKFPVTYDTYDTKGFGSRISFHQSINQSGFDLNLYPMPIRRQTTLDSGATNPKHLKDASRFLLSTSPPFFLRSPSPSSYIYLLAATNEANLYKGENGANGRQNVSAKLPFCEVWATRLYEAIQIRARA